MAAKPADPPAKKRKSDSIEVEDDDNESDVDAVDLDKSTDELKKWVCDSESGVLAVNQLAELGLLDAFGKWFTSRYEYRVHGDTLMRNSAVPIADQKKSQCMSLFGKGTAETKLPAMVANGRVTKDRKKIMYAYSYVAMEKFGPVLMADVPGKKLRRTDLVMSHVCGTRNCCQPRHIVLETKAINDERTHCHFVLAHIKRTAGYDRMIQLVDALCGHNPKCLTDNV